MIERLTKTCNLCGEEKLLDQFYKKTKTSYRNPCKSCADKRSKEWTTKNPEKRKEILNRNREKHLIKYKNNQVVNAIKWQERHPQKHLWASAKGRADKQGSEFTITPDDILIPDVCPVFKVKFERSTLFAMSLDRINPEHGYIPGNIQVISRLANTMKSNATQQELKQFAEWILNDG